VKSKETPICGLAAVKARFEREPGSIIRLFFDLPTGKKVGPLCKALAVSRRVYRQVEPAELEKISGTIHHGGIVAIIEQKALRTPRAQDVQNWARTRAPLVLLDRIGNAHNLGAIARTAAFFGVRHIIVPEHPQQALPGEAAHRVAEGGLEQLEVLTVKSLAGFCRELAVAGYEVAGTAVQGALPLGKVADDLKISGKAVAIVMGNEEHGMAPEVAKVCTRLVTIPGSGRVESLNVSVAAAVLMWELIGRCR
jgi:RNA methyltransferase, TrmH family